MNLTFDQLLQLAQLPAAVLLVIHVTLDLIAFVRGWVVPGYIYKAELKRNDTLAGSMAALTKIVEGVANDLPWIISGRKPRGPSA